jgi:hypothetical protein
MVVPGMFDKDHSADVVAASFSATPDPRLREVVTSLVRHLHAFAKEVQLTEQEWAAGIDFLTRTGQMCSDVRQEFILLSDILGLSMLVETINHRAHAGATESTVLGPFHVIESPGRALGDTIALDGKGIPCLVTGSVTGPDGELLAGAVVDVWQTNEDGYYDVQQPDVQPLGNLRGLFTTDASGGSGSDRWCPATTPSPTTGRSGGCWRRPGDTRTVPRTCTSSPRQRDTVR